MTFFTRIKIVGRENIIPRLDEDFRHFCRKSPRAYVDTARRRYFDKTVKEAQPGTIALLLLCTELFINPLPFSYNGNRLGFTFSKDNFQNDFTVTEITASNVYIGK